MGSLGLRLERLHLRLQHPFTIARGSIDVAPTLLFRLAWNGLEGLGESVPIARYGESIESVEAWYAAHPLSGADPYRMESLIDSAIPPAARCGLDLALYDLVAKACELPLYRFLGLDPERTPVTSFTIGLSDPETTLAKVREARDAAVLKVKLGSGDLRRDVETVALVRGAFTGTIRIDANEAWSAPDAVRALSEMERHDVEFCEQPIPAGCPEQLRYVREHARVPIVADEDALNARQLPALIGCVDGVNVKLAKTGGIRGALEMIHTARALGFKIMLGCMVESQVSASAAAHLSPLVDWADLDGPFLTADDPFDGICYDRGKIVLNDRPGLGVRLRERAA